MPTAMRLQRTVPRDRRMIGGRSAVAGRDDAGRVDGAAGLEGRVRRLGSGRGVGPDGRARAARRRSSASSRSGCSTISTPFPSRPTRSRSNRSPCSRRWRWRRGGSGSATWSSVPGFRNPAHTAKLSSTLDVISGGRFELGIGAGWKKDEWLAYGYGFPPIGERMDAFGDDLEVISRMFAPGHATYEGTHAHVEGRDQRPEGHPAAADPDHRRRQWREADGGLRDQVRRRAELRLPRRARDRRADGRGPAALRRRGPRPRDPPVLALRPRRGCPDGGLGPGRPARGVRRDRARPDRLLPDPLGSHRATPRPPSPRTSGRPGSSSPDRPGPPSAPDAGAPPEAPEPARAARSGTRRGRRGHRPGPGRSAASRRARPAPAREQLGVGRVREEPRLVGARGRGGRRRAGRDHPARRPPA